MTRQYIIKKITTFLEIVLEAKLIVKKYKFFSLPSIFPSFFAVKILKKTSPKVSLVMTFKIFNRCKLSIFQWHK